MQTVPEHPRPLLPPRCPLQPTRRTDSRPTRIPKRSVLLQGRPGTRADPTTVTQFWRFICGTIWKPENHLVAKSRAGPHLEQLARPRAVDHGTLTLRVWRSQSARALQGCCKENNLFIFRPRAISMSHLLPVGAGQETSPLHVEARLDNVLTLQSFYRARTGQEYKACRASFCGSFTVPVYPPPTRPPTRGSAAPRSPAPHRKPQCSPWRPARCPRRSGSGAPVRGSQPVGLGNHLLGPGEPRQLDGHGQFRPVGVPLQQTAFSVRACGGDSSAQRPLLRPRTPRPPLIAPLLGCADGLTCRLLSLRSSRPPVLWHRSAEPRARPRPPAQRAPWCCMRPSTPSPRSSAAAWPRSPTTGSAGRLHADQRGPFSRPGRGVNGKGRSRDRGGHTRPGVATARMNP